MWPLLLSLAWGPSHADDAVPLVVSAEVCQAGGCTAWPETPATDGEVRVLVGQAPLDAHLYVAALSKRGACDIVYPASASERASNRVTSDTTRLPKVAPALWQPTWHRLVVVAMSFRLESYDEGIICEMAARGRTLDEIVEGVRKPGDTWVDVFRALRSSPERLLEYRGSGETRTPPSAEQGELDATPDYLRPAEKGELARGTIGG